MNYSVINNVFIYSKEKEILRVLEGFNIFNISVREQSTVIKSPVESGIRISDNKVIMPRVIKVTGLCDNIRGEIETTKDTRSNINLGFSGVSNVANGVVDYIKGYEFETKQKILSVAKKVYEEIDKMYRERDVINVNGGRRPKTYSISTKGMIYSNMILSDVEQLNDPEHLLTIPVTLTFEELIFLGEQSAIPANSQDCDIILTGSHKEANLVEKISNWTENIF
jgi:hypothetical protein